MNVTSWSAVGPLDGGCVRQMESCLATSLVGCAVSLAHSLSSTPSSEGEGSTKGTGGSCEHRCRLVRSLHNAFSLRTTLKDTEILWMNRKLIGCKWPGGGGALEYLGVLGAWRSQWLSGIRGSLGGVGDFYGTLTAHKEYKASETTDGLGWHLTLWGHTWGS